MTSSPPVRVALERIPYDPVAWEVTIAGHPDVEVFHGSAWLEYLAATQGAEPVIAVVRADGRPVGHFVGAIVRRYGIRILGSPLRGWGTMRMGFLRVERVRQLIRYLQPSGQVVLVRVRAPDGVSIATSVVIGRGKSAILWGAAFRRAYADLHPNELLHWEAMRLWRGSGALYYDMGGGGEYKAKYGGVETPTFISHRSRYAVMRYGRSAVRRLFRARQVLAGRRARTAPGRDQG